MSEIEEELVKITSGGNNLNSKAIFEGIWKCRRVTTLRLVLRVII